MELISLAIRRLMEENRNRTTSHRSSDTDTDADDMQLLSQLLSEVESTREEQRLNHYSKQEDGEIIETNLEAEGENNVERSEIKVKTEEIVKELKEVKKQNFVTHCLVSAMIILTVAWQISEVSFILKLRDGLLSNPFKSLGTILKRKTTSAIQHQIEATELPQLNIPAIPHVSLPDFDDDS
ncbi:uncharacterized protein E6C27_scaffold46G003210 [Cucumis melo var. makuwa]|nr:uncharacterized protein E6C27_scaffold46G003210 [Cucumis melo var. makuwa]